MANVDQQVHCDRHLALLISGTSMARVDHTKRKTQPSAQSVGDWVAKLGIDFVSRHGLNKNYQSEWLQVQKV